MATLLAAIGTAMLQFLRQWIEESDRRWKQVLSDIAWYADELAHDPEEEYQAAGEYLRKAIRGYENAKTDYDYPDVCHWAVSAVEEIARQIMNTKQGLGAKWDLKTAARELEKRGWISSKEQRQLEDIYAFRNGVPGIAHGARKVPSHGAEILLPRARDCLAILFAVRSRLHAVK